MIAFSFNEYAVNFRLLLIRESLFVQIFNCLNQEIIKKMNLNKLFINPFWLYKNEVNFAFSIRNSHSWYHTKQQMVFNCQWLVCSVVSPFYIECALVVNYSPLVDILMCKFHSRRSKKNNRNKKSKRASRVRTI